MRVLKEERGYALLISMVLIVVFTVLGMGLLSININASKQFNIKEEQVQARHLAEKGVLHFKALLKSELDSPTFKHEEMNCSKLYGALLHRIKDEDYWVEESKNIKCTKSIEDGSIEISIDIGVLFFRANAGHKFCNTDTLLKIYSFSGNYIAVPSKS